MRQLYLRLRQQLAQLELRQCQTGEAIAEVQRRLRVLEEAMSWTAPDVEAGQEVRQEPESEPEFGIAEAKLVSAGV